MWLGWQWNISKGNRVQHLLLNRSQCWRDWKVCTRMFVSFRLWQSESATTVSVTVSCCDSVRVLLCENESAATVSVPVSWLWQCESAVVTEWECSHSVGHCVLVVTVWECYCDRVRVQPQCLSLCLACDRVSATTVSVTVSWFCQCESATTVSLVAFRFWECETV